MNFTLLKCVALVLVLMNSVAVIITICDKTRAKKKKRRIPEKTLFAVSLFGGAFGMYVTMLTVRHKTKHKRFMIGLPIILLLHILILFYFAQRVGIYG